MNTRMFSKIAAALLVLSTVSGSELRQRMWNDKCPCSFAETPEAGVALQKEIPHYHRDFRLQLRWNGGEPCRNPGERLSEKMALARKVIADVLKPMLLPENLNEEKFLLLQDVNFQRGRLDALAVRFTTEKYIIKVMQNERKVFVTTRLLSGEAIDVRKTSEEIFNTRILPAVWDTPLYFGDLKRASRIVRAGAWSPRDDWSIDDNGNPIAKDAHLPQLWGPIGLGFYKRVDFYTDGKFISYKLLGGPPVSRKKAEEGKEPDDN